MNTHGLTMKGLKAAAGATKGLIGAYSGIYEELFYNRSSGEVWTKTQVSLGHNSWTKVNDPEVIKVCNLDSPTTMQEIVELIKRRVEELP